MISCLAVSKIVWYFTGLKKFLKKNAEGDTLAVLDSKLGSIIKEKLNIPCIFRYLLHTIIDAV